jgi:hypothetical protein
MRGFTSGVKYIPRTPPLVSGRTRPRVKERGVTPTLNGCLGAFDALGESFHRTCELLDTLRNVVYRSYDFLDYGRHHLLVDNGQGQIAGGSWLERLAVNLRQGYTEFTEITRWN